MLSYVVLLIHVYLLNLSQGTVLRILKASACDFPKEANGSYLEFNATIDNGVFSGSFNIPFYINDSITYKMVSSELIDGKYVLYDAAMEGYFCDAVELYMPTIWKKVATLMKVDEGCPYMPGTYKIKGLTLAMSDLDMTVNMPPGNYRIEVIYMKDEVPVGCLHLESVVE